MSPKEASALVQPQMGEKTIERYARQGLIAARRFPRAAPVGRWLVRVRWCSGPPPRWELVELDRRGQQ